ncbi:MAG: methyltransferase domain-containing protein [Bacteroidia bacterium]|nr:methyltransferase domain-containing protein [Bacteroidia bacterium]
MIFRFKQFDVLHGKSSMKVGTDAVLLGIWSNIQFANTILDVGTGCGIISLIAAQKNQKAKIVGIDIDKNSVAEASLNFFNCKWFSRLSAKHSSIQNWAKNNKQKFDSIICNPPFFHKSTPSPVFSRHRARHSDSLSPLDFLQNCIKILNPTGTISIIIPSIDIDRWQNISNENCLYISRKTDIFSYPDKKAERTLLELKFDNISVNYSEIYIRNGKNCDYTKQYIELTKEFYIDLLSSQSKGFFNNL